MPLYHFTMIDGVIAVRDDEPLELPDIRAVDVEAAEGIRAVLADAAYRGLCRRHWRMDVTDERGDVVLSVSFADALRPDSLAA